MKASFIGWSHDRKSFYFTTNERDARFFDLYEMPIDTLKATMVYKDETGFEFGDISRRMARRLLTRMFFSTTSRRKR